MVEDTVGLIVVVAVVYVAYNWLTKAKPSGPQAAAGPPVMGQGILRGVNESMVQTVSSAFPDIPRENILYDLSKTRNVQSTFERILEVGTLPAPPASLFPPALPAPPAPSTGSSSARTTATQPQQTLIDRFGLASRLPSVKGKERAVDDSIEAETTKIGSNAAKWESTAEEREKSLKRRKEEMVLEARRKLLEKKAKAAAAVSA